jgi:hypothetical protein
MGAASKEPTPRGETPGLEVFLEARFRFVSTPGAVAAGSVAPTRLSARGRPGLDAAFIDASEEGYRRPSRLQTPEPGGRARRLIGARATPRDGQQAQSAKRMLTGRRRRSRLSVGTSAQAWAALPPRPGRRPSRCETRRGSGAAARASTAKGAELARALSRCERTRPGASRVAAGVWRGPGRVTRWRSRAVFGYRRPSRGTGCAGEPDATSPSSAPGSSPARAGRAHGKSLGHWPSVVGGCSGGAQRPRGSPSRLSASSMWRRRDGRRVGARAQTEISPPSARRGVGLRLSLRWPLVRCCGCGVRWRSRRARTEPPRARTARGTGHGWARRTRGTG